MLNTVKRLIATAFSYFGVWATPVERPQPRKRLTQADKDNLARAEAKRRRKARRL